VFAAASLSEVMQELGAAYQQASGVAVRVSFASTAVLAHQIEAGAAADVFVAADLQWMDYLQTRALLQARSRTVVAGNALVLIAPADSPVQLQLAPGAPLAASLDGGRLAVGDPDSVPVGRYARAALQGLGLWDGIATQLVRADDARAALAFVARGEAPLGIVYATDARGEPAVRIVATFPAAGHPAIVYPAALTRDAAPAAVGFLHYLGSADARRRFASHGFVPP
jgi:molybdate transport system substrate-binding protein